MRYLFDIITVCLKKRLCIVFDLYSGTNRMESLIVWKQYLKQKTLLFCATSLSVYRYQLNLFFCIDFYVYVTHINQIFYWFSDLVLPRNSAICSRSHFFQVQRVRNTPVSFFFSATSVLLPPRKVFNSVPIFEIWQNAKFNF